MDELRCGWAAVLVAVLCAALGTKARASISDGAILARDLEQYFADFDASAWPPINYQGDPCTSHWKYIECDNNDNVIGLIAVGLGLPGSLPNDFALPPLLQTLNMSHNNLSNDINVNFGQLPNLAVLDFSYNNFSGPIPANLGSIPALRNLSLAHNNLSGPIPESLKYFPCSSFSENVLLDCTRGGNGECAAPSCGLTPPPPPAVPKGPPSPRGSSVAAAIGGGVGGGLGALLLVIAALLIWWWRSRPVKKGSILEFDEGKFRKLRRYTFMELARATGNFNSKSVLGVGSFGRVFKGKLPDGRLVAIKRLAGDRILKGEKNFLNELEVFNRAMHKNLLNIEGFCIDVGERILVFPFMANGSISSQLQGKRMEGKPALTWPQRKQIAIGTAEGLNYMHTACNPRLLHCDLKADNVLLTEAYEARVADFGLAQILDHQKARSTAVKGTIGYLPKEYFTTGQMSEKTDVFSFGVLLLELTAGQSAYSLGQLPDEEGMSLHEWVARVVQEGRLTDFVDNELEAGVDLAEVENMVNVALLCTLSNCTARPTMAECVAMLQGTGLAAQWEEWHTREVMRYQDREQMNYGAAAMGSGSGSGLGSTGSTESFEPFHLSGPR